MSLTVPALPSEKKFPELLTLLRNHFSPKENKRAERFKFNKIVQEQGEQINDFIVRLKAAAQTCRFGDFFDTVKKEEVGEYKLKIIDEMLADRFIVGLKNEKIQQNLLGDDSLSFEQCCQKALNMESSENASRSIQPAHQNAVYSQNKYGKKSNPPTKNQFKHYNNNSRDNARQKYVSEKRSMCSRCGKPYHENCPAVNWSCFVCGKSGHTSVVCRFKRSIKTIYGMISTITHKSSPM